MHSKSFYGPRCYRTINAKKNALRSDTLGPALASTNNDMATLKTQKSRASVPAFIKSVDNERRREDALALLEIFEQVTKMKPKLWGTSIIGFGEYHYESERSSQKGEWPLTGFSPRKRNISVYIMPGFADYQDLLEQLGKHKTSVSCLYFTKLEDIDVKILKQIIRKSVAEMKKKYTWKN